MDARPSPDQYGLDFTSRRNELIALTSGLSRVPLEVDGKTLSMGRVYGVIDLLKRLLCVAPDARNDQIVVVAQVPYLGAAMHGFRVVSERTLERWSKDAQALGLIEVDVRAWKFGNRNWNEWTIRIDHLRHLISLKVARHDPTRPDTVSGPRPDTVSGPRPDTVSGPQIREVNPEKEMNHRPGPVCAGPARSSFDCLPDWRELLPIRDAIVDPISDEQLASLSDEQRAWLAGKRAFEPLTERWLGDESDLEFWHRWQLRSADPAVGATQAHLALVLATARHAVAFPKSRLKRNRVALFVGILSKRNWEPVRGRLAGVLSEMLVAR